MEGSPFSSLCGGGKWPGSWPVYGTILNPNEATLIGEDDWADDLRSGNNAQTNIAPAQSRKAWAGTKGNFRLQPPQRCSFPLKFPSTVDWHAFLPLAFAGVHLHAQPA